MATVEIRELIKPETGEKFYPYAHLNGVKGAELLPRIGGSVQTTLPTPIFQIKDALNAQFYPQTHAEAVIGLAQMIESNQFFVKESDGNGGYRIKLKDEFTGFYANSWVAAGGVGTGGGGGGGGLITSVKGVADLGTPIAVESLTETFSAKAIETIWETVDGLQQSIPIVSLANGVSYSSVSVNGTTANFYTKDQVDSLLDAINAFDYVVASSLPTASADTMYKIYLIPSADPQTQNAKDEYITIRSGSAGSYSYTWEQIGSTAIDLTGYATESWVNQQGFLTASALNGYATQTWANNRFLLKSGGDISGDIYHEIEEEEEGSDESVIDEKWRITENGDATFGSLSVGGVDFSTINSRVSTLWNARNNYLPIAGGTMTGDVTFNSSLLGPVSAGTNRYWSIDSDGTASFEYLSVGGIQIDPTKYVTLNDAQTITGIKTFTNSLYGKTVASHTNPDWYIDNDGSASFENLQVGGSGVVTIGNAQEITGAKTFSGGITMSGANIIPGTDSTCAIGTSSNRFSDGSIRNLHVTTFDFRDGSTPNTQIGGIYCGSDIMQLQLGSGGANGLYNFGASSGLFHNGNGTVPCGRSDHRWSKVWTVDADLSGSMALGGDIIPATDLGSQLGYSTRRFSNACIRDIYAQNIRFRNADNNANTGLISFSLGYMQLRTGSNIDSSFKQLIFDETNGLYPYQSGVNLGYNGANNRWATIYGVNADLTGDLSLAQTSHIDIGPARIEYDATNGAIHITTNQTGNNAPVIGFYADGFSAAGGVGEGGGGGGYGVEQITTNEDGTIDFHFTGGDVTTVDLNHEHPQYPKYVHLSSESEMPANPDPYTMYIIDGSGGGGGGSYTLPIASASTLGGVKVGTGLSIDSTTGVLSATGGSSYTLPTASASTLGGVKVGDGLSINSSTGVLTTATKIVYLTSESQMPASPDANTLYVILES